MGKLMGRVKHSVRAFKNTSLIKKTVLTTCVGLGMAFGSVYADSVNDSFVEVYHVYVDSKHVGTVENKEDVESYIKELEEQAENEYDQVDLVPEQDISYVSEVVFTPKDEVDEVQSELGEQISFNASAVKLQLNDEVLGYVSDLKTANQAINRVVSKYLPEDLKQDFELLTMDNNEIHTTSILNHLPKEYAKDTEEDKEEKENEKIKLNDGSVVVDLGLTENLTFSQQGVDPKELLSAEQLQKMLERGTKGKEVHTIKENEVLGQVASEYDLSFDELLELNPDLNEDSIVQVGQEVFVEAEKPIIDVTYTKETEEEESIGFETEYKDTDSLYKGQTEVEQQGKKGTKRIKYEITTKNNEVINKVKVDEEVVEDPRNKVVLRGTKVIDSRGSGQFANPTVGGILTSTMGYRWGRMHKGIDISGVSDPTIKAADNGTVSFAGNDGAFGKKVVINHNNGYKTLYAHLSSISVSSGQTVKRGQKIGVMGSSGSSTGTHLHFEVLKNGSNVNPLNFVGY
ncbi:peptidoglycan DD-metalloendopeptidase family protein [Aquisalibacillus elongatus]|uniref:Murein DD-endopeptidase MepM/ murein hydrolase activator NlpD n=1 Tax=Aquisalibacillus elongatus TaxID=485577 RepID=A0A3N5B1U0_9BACI|nr:M23 family metallopeptidase [Aquisalibacillus elongatus]RPF51109.1 murein DD-endopeptidase MepM/ murein hydrolase activator NlpD [Aquisalibacillus elongatus]